MGQKEYNLPVIDGIRSGSHHPFSTADATPRSIVCCMRDLLASAYSRPGVRHEVV